MAAAIEDQLVASTASYNVSFSMSTAAPWTAIGTALKSATTSDNNMVMVSANVYDGGSAGGDGNLTQATQYVSATSGDTRVTSYGYDWRDRQTSIDGEVDFYAVYTYDNLDRITQIQRYNTTSSGNLIGQSATNYDNRGRIYQRITYAVDPSTGTVGNSITTNSWYDPSGNMLQQISGGDGNVFSKTAYNGVGWVTASYRGFNYSTSYSQALTVANDTIVEQVQNTYDEAGNIISAASFQRLNDASLLTHGALTSSIARISYSAVWFDGIDRSIATANYGAITGTFTRPSTPPTSSSSSVLVSSITYDDAGRVQQTGDPAGDLTQTTYDNAGRTTQTIEAEGSGSDRTTNYTYTLDNQIAAITAINGSSSVDDLTTTYTYGTRLTSNGVARKDLLVSITYPDSTSGSDVVSYTYNRLGQQTTITDQRGTVRTIYYDTLGRLTNDCVTTVGSADGTVRQVAKAYEVRGMVQTITSYDSDTPNSGTVLNQTQMTYNSFSQLTQQAQEHDGSVSSSSPTVGYEYQASGESNPNQIRLVAIAYPNGRTILYTYSSGSEGLDIELNRFNCIIEFGTGIHLATYTYLGMSTVVQIEYSEPGVMLDLWGGTSGTFAGIDLFGRVIDQRWTS